MLNINNYVLPFIIIFIILYGYFKKINVYDSFLKGTIDGFKVVIDITPTIITMIFVINIFIESNFFGYILSNIKLIKPESLSMMLLRPVSGNATLGIMQEIFIKYGPDSFNGILASLMQGSTETTIYVLALYFGSIGVKNYKNTLKIGLLVDLFGILLAFTVTYFFFK